MQLFHWPIMGALQGIAVLSAPALFAMAGFAPDLTIEIASTEAADEATEDAEDIIELAEDAIEVADAAEEAAEDEAEETIEEELEEEAAEELEQAAEELEQAAEEAEGSEPTCWVAPSGSLYHLDPDCTYIRNKDALTEMTVEEAENADRRPCSRCAQ